MGKKCNQVSNFYYFILSGVSFEFTNRIFFRIIFIWKYAQFPDTVSRNLILRFRIGLPDDKKKTMQELRRHLYGVVSCRLTIAPLLDYSLQSELGLPDHPHDNKKILPRLRG